MLTNETFRNLIDSVYCTNDKFDTFGNQIQELIKSMKDMTEENKILKYQNNLQNYVNLLKKN